MLTQEELADRAGLDSRTVRRLEAGELRRPRSSTLRLVAGALDLSEPERSQLRAALPDSVTRQAPPATAPVSRQLPADAAHFTGRTLEVDSLLEGRGPGAAVWAIDGMAGIGKTTLAVHAAHEAADAYPDGQLFVDLRGASQRPVDPAEALGRLLRSLDIPGDALPSGLDARSALFRSQLARRRVLVVLDDAAGEDQIAPLLPGTGDSLVIVTSRRRLAGLDRRRTVSLDVLPAPDAVRLFVDSAESPGLLDDASDVVATTVELCGRVPLAIRVAAARLRSRRGWTLADLNARLSADGRLDELVAGARGMAAALDTSVEQLAETQARVYDLLGLTTGPHIGLGAASALVDLDARDASAALAALVECHLLDELAPDRFGMHELVREHARRRVAMSGRAAEAPAAVRRMLDYYLATTATVVRVAYPYVPIQRPGDATDHAVPTHRDAAQGWLDTELDTLLACAVTAREQGLDQHVVDLSALLDRHLAATAWHRPAFTLHEAAVGCAHRRGDGTAEALALSRLAFVRRRLGQPDQATELYRSGLALAHEVASPRAAAIALVGLADLLRLRDDYDGARSALSEALVLARTADGAPLLPEVLAHLGHVHRQFGSFAAAEECLTEAITLTRHTGHDQVQLDALINLGYIRMATGRTDEAADGFARALDLARDDRSLAGEASALLGLGYVLLRRGDPAGATVRFQDVDALAERLDSDNWRLEAALARARASQETDPGRAAEQAGHALAIAQALDHATDAVRAHDVLAGALARTSDPSGAAEHWDRALELLASLGVDVLEDGTSLASISQQRALLANSRPDAAGG